MAFDTPLKSTRQQTTAHLNPRLPAPPHPFHLHRLKPPRDIQNLTIRAAPPINITPKGKLPLLKRVGQKRNALFRRVGRCGVGSTAGPPGAAGLSGAPAADRLSRRQPLIVAQPPGILIQDAIHSAVMPYTLFCDLCPYYVLLPCPPCSVGAMRARLKAVADLLGGGRGHTGTDLFQMVAPGSGISKDAASRPPSLLLHVGTHQKAFERHDIARYPTA